MMPPKALTGIAGERLGIGRGEIVRDRDAAGIGMLDDGDGGLGELGRQLVGGVGVVEIVVGELLALDLPRRGDARPLVAPPT